MSLILFWNRGISGGTSVYSPYSSLQSAVDGTAINRSSVSALAFLVWDILVTFDDEVRLIWPGTFTTMKYVYFVSRYLSLLAQIPLLLVGSELSPHFHFTRQQCYMWQIYQGVLTSILILTVDVILIIRVRAMYHGCPKIRHGVIVLFILEVVGMIVGLCLALPGIEFDEICVVLHIPHQLGVYGVSSIAFQTILFALTAAKFVREAKAGWGNVPLVVILMRDGTWAFLLIFCVYMGQVVLYVIDGVGGVLFPWMLTLSSFCGYRIILNLRRYAMDSTEDRIANIDTITPTPEVSVSL